MVSASRLSNHLNQVFNLAHRTGISFKVHHRKVIYLMTITPTGEKYVNPAKGAVRPLGFNTKKPVKLEITKCDSCGHSKLTNICINKFCKTNKRSS